jgi:hypothetical protein
LGFALAACAPARIALPTDPGSALPDFAQIHSQVSSACAGVRTLTAELALSGQAGDQKLRGRVIAGFERPSSIHLQGVAPFGPPLFVLAGRGDSAALLLPRDSRIVRNAAPEAILEALTGVSLTPADLQAVLTGCVVPSPRATGGRLHGNGWASIDVESSGPPARHGTRYLQRGGTGWRVRAARRDRWQIEYPVWPAQFPESVRLSAEEGGVPVDLRAGISQVEPKRDLDAAAFTVQEPPNVQPMTLQELRTEGPLRGSL